MIEDNNVVKVLKNNNIDDNLIDKILIELNYYNGCNCYPSEYEMETK